MTVRSRTRLVGASVAVLAALTATFIAWPGTSGAAMVPQARADLVNASGDPLGSVIFLGRGGHATQVRVDLDVPTTGVVLNDFHGLHVHANGICDPVVAGANTAVFFTAGPHWTDAAHPNHGTHLGDLPSVLIGSDGTASLTADVPRFEVSDIAGRAVILHAGRDNFGNVPTGTGTGVYTANDTAATTATNGTGNAGARYGCGVIQPVS
jgi:Cu-Zn family superoxide dismutase